jgi:tetratricopeptide (TPR) repeat protein
MLLRFFVVFLTLVLMPSLSEAQSSDQTKPAAPSKGAIETIKEKSAKATRMNELIAKANQAIQARDWRQVEELALKLIAEDPAAGRFYQLLGDAQLNLEEYEQAVKTYDKALELVSKETDSPARPDLAKARTAAMSVMLTNQGNCYLKLRKTAEAIAAYTKAAAIAPNPGTAYFNLCATQYNTGNVDGALDACNKAIAADPQRADAYFIKGSLLLASSLLSKDGRVHPAPGTVEALRKYLELKPDGPHAGEVKQMLEYLGEK